MAINPVSSAFNYMMTKKKEPKKQDYPVISPKITDKPSPVAAYAATKTPAAAAPAQKSAALLQLEKENENIARYGSGSAPSAKYAATKPNTMSPYPSNEELEADYKAVLDRNNNPTTLTPEQVTAYENLVEEDKKSGAIRTQDVIKVVLPDGRTVWASKPLIMSVLGKNVQPPTYDENSARIMGQESGGASSAKQEVNAQGLTMEQANDPKYWKDGKYVGVDQTVAATPKEKSALERAYDAYVASLAPSTEKTAAQTAYLNWKQGKDTSLQNIAEQPIAMPFISGQQASVERRAQIEGERLQGDVALEEERQKAQQAGLLATLGFQENQAKLEAAKSEPIAVGAGTTLFDRLTGKPVYTAPETPTTPAMVKEYEYARGQGYAGTFADYQKDIAAAKAQVSTGATPTSYDEYVRTDPSPTPEEYAEFLATKKGVAGTSSPQAVKFQQDTADRVVNDVDLAMEKLSGWTAGLGGAVLKNIPGTEAKNFSGFLDTLKANIGFGVLQDMRNASKTGGALGQISDRENVLLSSVLGSLDQAQSVEQIKANLTKIKGIMMEWQAALAENAANPTATQEGGGGGEFDW